MQNSVDRFVHVISRRPLRAENIMGQMSDPKAQLTDEVNKTLNYHPLPFS
jgi:hypothetical protein